MRCKHGVGHLVHSGMTLVETLVTVTLLGILATLSAPIFDTKEPFSFRVNRIASQFRLSRSRAIAQTSAYKIRASSNNQFIVERSSNCSSTNWTTDSYFFSDDLKLSNPRELEAGEGVILSEARLNGQVVNPNTNWSLCYDSRGISNQDLRLTFQEVATDHTIQMQVFAGGAIQIYEY